MRLSARSLLGAALAACLLPGAAQAAPSKLDARLRAKRAPPPGAIGPAAAGSAAAGQRHRVLLRVAPGSPAGPLASLHPGIRLGAQLGEAVSAEVPDEALEALAADGRVREVAAAVRLKPTLDVSRSSTTFIDTGITRYYGTLRNGAADVAAALGAGVVVGIVDTGIDWNHRDFSNDGTPDTTRILAIWDQTISSHTGAPFPTGYAYGAEYEKADIDAKLAGGANVINTQDTDGHGTHVASIAAGDGTATDGLPGSEPAGTYKGFAPAADIIMVKTTFFDADIIDGIAYIVAKAAAAGKRAVINLSLGGQSGPHDGSSTFETGISAVAASTPVFVASGNDHDASPHAKHTYTGLTTSNFTANTPAVSSGWLEFWHPGGDAYTVTVTLLGQGGSVIATSGNNNSGTIAGHTVTVSNAENVGHPSGDKQILVNVAKSGGITVTQVTASLTRTSGGGSGRVDGYVDPSLEGLTWATFVEVTGSVATPATADDVISVGSYASKQSWESDDLSNNVWGYFGAGSQATLGETSLFSGAGPTRDGRQAPELVAPGDAVVAALSAQANPNTFCDYSASETGCYIVKDSRHLSLRGTSMASPAAAGAAATRLALQPGLTVAQLKTTLRALARSDTATGSVPNDYYGYGKLVASPQPVSPPAGFSVTTLGQSSVSWSWGTLTGAAVYNLYNATNTSSLVASVSSPQLVQTGLAANTTYGLFVRGNAGGVDGPGTFIATATYASPVAAGAAVAYVSSITLSYATCPASPQASSCGGYSFSASADPGFAGVVFASATTNRALGSLTVTGLSPLTTYYLRLTTLNPSPYLGGVPVPAGSTRTLTDLQAPTSPSTSETSSVTMRLHWSDALNPPGQSYVAYASSDPSFGAVVFSSTTRNLSALFSSLSVNTSYWFRVSAVSGPYLSHGPVPTHAVPVGAPGAPFTAVSSESVTVNWTAGLDPPGTLYTAQLSPDPAFGSGVLSSATYSTAATWTGLSPNTLYHGRVTAVSHGGVASAATPMGSTATLAQPVVALASPFSAVQSSSFTFSFSAGANPAGTRFLVRVSTDPGFSVVHGSSNTANTSAAFSGLLSNQLYWAQAAAVNQSGAVAPYSAAQSTATRVAAVSAAGVPVSTRTAASLTAAWTAAGFGAGTQYLAEADDDPGFGSVNASSTTLNAFATLSGLSPDTVYHVRARALSQNPPTPDGAATLVAPSERTLSNPPVIPPSPLSGLGTSSVTVSFLPPMTGTYSGVRVEASTSLDYSSPVSSVVAAGHPNAVLAGLSFASTYYVRVAALNGAGAPSAYAYAGSTVTYRPQLSSGTAAGGAIALSLPVAFAVFPSAQLTAEPGTFPHNTLVRIVAGTSLDLAAARGAVPLTALGAGIAYDIDASGYQPSKPVRLTLAYDASQIPAGQDARRLRLARYDPATGLWQLAPSAVDTKDRTLTASLDHFSVYAPFFTTAGTDADATLIFPNPWELGGASEYHSQAMTFASLPDGANVKVLTMGGELVWEGVAGPSGVLTWDGNNRFGHKAGSATYYVVIKSGKRAAVKRAVLVR